MWPDFDLPSFVLRFLVALCLFVLGLVHEGCLLGRSFGAFSGGEETSCKAEAGFAFLVVVGQDILLSQKGHGCPHSLTVGEFCQGHTH